MFYILVVAGISLIVIGINKKKNEFKYDVNNSLSTFERVEDFIELRRRIENLEKTLYYDEPQLEESISLSYPLQKYKLLCQYEIQNYSMEEICRLLDMKKGEVLLLKNLYKDYGD